MKLHVNGLVREITSPPGTPLVWVLRDELGLTGTKYSCGIAECGACTVLVDGEATLACQMPVGDVAGQEVVTIEGLSSEVRSRVIEAWMSEEVPQCGFCQPGQIITATALLSNKPQPTDAEIDEAMTVLCRCGSYPDIRRAIHRAAKEI